jgi:leucyl/phenylalanyl-tRNA--protein transferase
VTEARHARGSAAGRPEPSPFARVVPPPGEDLVAWGGDLDPELVLDAYRHGMFPMGEEEGPVLWWSPDPRGVLPLEDLHVPRRLARTCRRPDLDIRADTAFGEVMRACDERRADGRWLHAGMLACYDELHRRGHAHSVEVWRAGRLVGGTYGVAVGGAFAAESKFHRERDLSKVALVALVRRLRERGFALLDVQWRTPHLAQFGVAEIPRDDYLRRLRAAADLGVTF